MIYQGLLGLAVIILFFLHFSGPSSSKSSPETEANASSDSLQIADSTEVEAEDALKPKSAVSMAYVNTDSLLLQYDYYVRVEKQLTARRRAMEADIQNRQNQLQEEAIQFQQSLQTGAMTEATARQAQEGLMKKEQNLVQYGQGLEKTYIEEEQKKNEELNRRVKDFVEQYSKENGFDFIFGYSLSTVAQGVLHGDVRYDITKEVLAGLNKAYQEEQKNQ